MTTFKKKIFFIIGPTASGKTSLSIELAKKLGNSEIISADSRQIYKGFDLSSGKVTKEEMGNIPHHMLDIVEPGEYFSVVDYTNLALEKIEEIYSRGNIPIICGGTGFYIDSLLYDYDLPEVTKNDNLRKELELKTNTELYKILIRKLFAFKNWKYVFSNFKTYKRFSILEFKNNPHRLTRAIEIVDKLGFIPELKKSERFSVDQYEVKIISTKIDRTTLKEKINKRLLDRLDAGMVEEIEKVKAKYNLSFEYLESLGLEFKWVSKFLKKELSEEEMIENLNKEIYQYARRQESWFKRYHHL
jgi:tRNA dimethylallyltransferase